MLKTDVCRLRNCLSIALADHWRESYVCETGKSMIAVDLAGLKRMDDVNRDYTHHAARRGFECNGLVSPITLALVTFFGETC